MSDFDFSKDIENRPEKGIRRSLYIIIFEAETKWGRWFDIVLLWAILFSILEVILESDRGFQEKYSLFTSIFEITLTTFFTIEYILRIWVSKKPIKYMKSFFGIVDILSILPTYISFFVPGSQYLLVIRGLRLLRVVRILKLVRFNNASQDLLGALKASRFKIYIFLGFISALVLIMGTIMHLVEGNHENGFSSISKSMYWTIVTMTTVGYGDIVPTTVLGKFAASVMMLIGYAIIAIPTGIVTSEMQNYKRQKNGKCKRCDEDLFALSIYCHKCGLKIQST